MISSQNSIFFSKVYCTQVLASAIVPLLINKKLKNTQNVVNTFQWTHTHIQTHHTPPTHTHTHTHHTHTPHTHHTHAHTHNWDDTLPSSRTLHVTVS